MAKPLRFRRSTGSWSAARVRDELRQSLDDAIGAASSDPNVNPPPGYEARRFDMENGDIALFAWSDDDAYWLGNTETPSVLWRTDKYGFAEVPYPIARWGQRELLGELETEDPWLAAYDHVAWFFLPVFFSKDGRETTREFFRDHAAGFPDASRDAALSYLEEFLRTGVFDDERHTMASKLGTSEQMDLVRMSATMGEFNAARLLVEAGYEITPEIEVTTGHSLDFRADEPADGRASGDGGTDGGRPAGNGGTLVEVTRPRPPSGRVANTPVAAVRDTAETKTSGQLSKHGGGAVLFVDCSSFRDDEWAAVRGERPEVRHRPAVVFRARPDGRVEAYSKGTVPLNLDGAVEWAN